MKDLQERDATGGRAEIAANLLAWIHDLETTTEPQTSEKLYRHSGPSSGYCCLGRACVVLGVHLEPVPDEDYSIIPGIDAAMVGCLDNATQIRLGLTVEEHDECFRLNDREEKTFPEIAAWLRAEVLPRFLTPGAVESPSPDSQTP